jgi:hypothetical protein
VATLRRLGARLGSVVSRTEDNEMDAMTKPFQLQNKYR